MPRGSQKKISSAQAQTKNATHKPAPAHNNSTRQRCRRGKGGASHKPEQQPVAVATGFVEDAKADKCTSDIQVNAPSPESGDQVKVPPSPFVFPGLASFESPATQVTELPPLEAVDDRPYVHPSLVNIPPKTYPCKHFVRTRGWCPYEEKCHFLHDPSILPESPDSSPMKPTSRCHSPAASVSTSTSSRWSGSTLRDGSCSPTLSTSNSEAPNNDKPDTTIAFPRRYYCWSYVQGLCNVPNCDYLHPRNIAPYISMTPCLTYPACLDKRDCPFKHPESSLNFFAQAPEKCLNGDSNLPSGCHEVNGTVYFPLPINLLPQSNPATPDTRYVFATPQGYEFVPSPGAAPLPWTAVCPGTAETSHEVFSSTEATIPNFTPTQANFTIPSLESSSTHSGHKPCALDALAILPPNPPTANTGFHQPPAPEGSIISLVQNSILREGSQMCC